MAKSSKKNTMEVNAFAVLSNGYETLNCVIESDEGNIMKVLASKPGSSSIELRVIPREHIYAYKGGIGKPSTVIIKGDMVFAEFPAAVIEPDKNGFVKVSTNDGEIMVRADMIRARAVVAKNDAPESLKEAKKLKPTDALKTSKPKTEQTPEQARTARENLKKANAKNQEKKNKKRDRS